MKYRIEPFALVGGLLFLCGLFLADSKARTLPRQDGQAPLVVKAVAPPFIPFIFGKTGSATVVVEVTVDLDGKVSESRIVEASLFRDKAFEETAKKWVFAPAVDGKKGRKARLTFILRIVEKSTPWDEVTTIFTSPYQVEVRHEVFDPYTNSDPNPVKPR